jgi:calcium-dependent protein kinase
MCRFLAPEALSSHWSQKSDVWAAGVMAYQLLTGRLPFNDKRNPHSPILSAVLRSILTEPLNFNKAYWQDISQDGKDFVKFMLDRDLDTRPTASEALSHPWLSGDVTDRQKGQQMPLNVVQRIQRFGRIDVLKRSLLELIATELAEDDMAPVQPFSPCLCFSCIEFDTTVSNLLFRALGSLFRYLHAPC